MRGLLMSRLLNKIFIFSVFFLFLGQEFLCAGEKDLLKKQVTVLLDSAEVFSATQNRKAIVFADSALALSMNIDDLSLYMRALKIKMLTFLYMGDYDRCVDAAMLLKENAVSHHNDSYRMYAFIGLGQSYIMKNLFDESKVALDSALVLGLRLEDDFALSSVYNGLGIYHTNADANYYRAIDYYLQGIESAERSSNERLHSVLLCNLSGVYYLKKDKAGLTYALQCYLRGHQLKESFLVYIGAMNTAYCYYLEGNYDEALRYLREAEVLLKEKEYLNQANLYVLFGNIYFDQGAINEAEDYYEKALHESEQTKTSDLAQAHLGLGKVAAKSGHYQQAIQYIRQGIELATFSNDNALDRRDLYYELSRCYEAIGNYAEALAVYKLFTEEDHHIFDQDKEYHLSELMIKYEAEQTKNLLKEKDLALLQKEKRLQLQYFAICIIVLGLILMLIRYWRKNKRYMDIVRQNYYLLEQEKVLKRKYDDSFVSPSHVADSAEIEEPDHVVVVGGFIPDPETLLDEESSPHPSNGEKYATSALSEQKSVELYQQLHRLMLEEKLYKDPGLTKDRLSDILHTNRSYLSQVINQHTGLSYNHFINRLRIDEVLRILSDPNDDTPLKAIASDIGFKSLGTFYNAFQSVVGMPPSAYRSKMREILRKQNLNSKK